MNMNVRTKRRLSAWLLLLVFVPMLLSSLHVHPTVGVEDSCTECVNHVPHSGHVSLLTAHSCDCLLCQFVALVYVAGAATLLSILAPVWRTPQADCSAFCPSVFSLTATTRGPPTV